MKEDTHSSIPISELISQILEISKSQGNLLLGMIYGSQKKGDDLDILLIYNNNVKQFPVYDNNVRKNILANNFDIGQIEINNFQKKIFYRDIQYTDKILTGKYLCGNKDIFEKAKDFLINTSPNKHIYDYLGKRSIETFLQADQYYFLAKRELFAEMLISNMSWSKMKNYFFETGFELDSEILNKSIFINLNYSLSILSYSLSYLSSIKRYKKGERTVTLQGILDNPLNQIENELKNLRNYFKLCYKKEKKISLDKINSYFGDVKALLNEEI